MTIVIGATFFRWVFYAIIALLVVGMAAAVYHKVHEKT